jgi:transposase
MALGFLTVANIYKPPAILRGILPDLVKASEPALLADKGYDSLRFRRFVQEHGFRPLIPTRRCIPSEQATGELYAEETVLQRKRYVVERTLGWLKSFRRLRYRVDRTRTSFQAFVYLAILVLCVRRLISTTSRGTSRQCANRPAWGWTYHTSQNRPLVNYRSQSDRSDRIDRSGMRCTVGRIRSSRRAIWRVLVATGPAQAPPPALAFRPLGSYP